MKRKGLTIFVRAVLHANPGTTADACHARAAEVPGHISAYSVYDMRRVLLRMVREGEVRAEGSPETTFTLVPGFSAGRRRAPVSVGVHAVFVESAAVAILGVLLHTPGLGANALGRTLRPKESEERLSTKERLRVAVALNRLVRHEMVKVVGKVAVPHGPAKWANTYDLTEKGKEFAAMRFPTQQGAQQ